MKKILILLVALLALGLFVACDESDSIFKVNKEEENVAYDGIIDFSNITLAANSTSLTDYLKTHKFYFKDATEYGSKKANKQGETAIILYTSPDCTEEDDVICANIFVISENKIHYTPELNNESIWGGGVSYFKAVQTDSSVIFTTFTDMGTEKIKFNSKSFTLTGTKNLTGDIVIKIVNTDKSFNYETFVVR